MIEVRLHQAHIGIPIERKFKYCPCEVLLLLYDNFPMLLTIFTNFTVMKYYFDLSFVLG